MNSNENAADIVVQENILYSTCSDLSTFFVAADQHDGCLKNGLQGRYRLKIGHGVVQLLQHDTENEVITWSLFSLKNFGYSPNTVFFEAGSRTITGAGKFTFYTTEGEIINQYIKLEAKILYAQSHKSESDHLAKFAVATAGSSTNHVGTIKAKPPAPPKKPKSFSLRTSGNEFDQQESKSVNDHHLSKKTTPAFGVPVLLSLTAQTSKLRVSDSVSPSAEYDTCNSKSFNGLDHTADCHMENGKKNLMLTRSISAQSSESESKRDKKAQKQFKKEQKKREEEEKKEKKRKEEEKKREHKRREEEEKKIRKELKKSKQRAGKRPSESSSTSLGLSKNNPDYSEADVFLSTYSEVNIDSIAAKPQIETNKSNPENIYSEPWGTLPLIPMPPAGDSNEVEYAQPEKRALGKVASLEPRDVIHSENYEDLQVEGPQYSAPVINPPNWEQEDDSSTDVYSHLNENRPRPTEQESVYGMGSASDTVPVFEDENPYEDTNILT